MKFISFSILPIFEEFATLSPAMFFPSSLTKHTTFRARIYISHPALNNVFTLFMQEDSTLALLLKTRGGG